MDAISSAVRFTDKLSEVAAEGLTVADLGLGRMKTGTLLSNTVGSPSKTTSSSPSTSSGGKAKSSEFSGSSTGSHSLKPFDMSTSSENSCDAAALTEALCQRPLKPLCSTTIPKPKASPNCGTDSDAWCEGYPADTKDCTQSLHKRENR
jgi:hypothetical protein